MKKLLLIIMISISLFTYGETKVKIESNITDMYLYKNLYSGKYEGVYSDFLKDVDKNIEYSFSYKDKPELLLRVTNTEKYPDYKFIPTPINYRVMVLVNKYGKIRNVSDLMGLRIGYIVNSRGLEEFKDRFSYLKYDRVKIENEDIALEKLENKEIDALIIEDYIERNSFESSIRILEDTLYKEKIGVRNDCENLYTVVEENIREKSKDSLMDILKNNRINYYKYLLEDTPNYIAVKEKYKKIKVLVPKDKYLLPLYYSLNGEYNGILIDILKEIEAILDIPIEVTTEKGDILPMLVSNEESRRKYSMSKPYYQNKIGIANRKYDSFAVGFSDLDNSKIIMLKSADSLKNFILKVVNNSEIIFVPTMEEGFKRLISGDGEYFITFSSFLESGITNRFLDKKIKLAGTLNDTVAIGLGVKKEDTELGQVINTIMRGFAIDKTVLDSKANNNILVAKNYKLIAQIVIPLIIFMVILIIVLLKSEKNRRKAEKLSCILVEAFESINQLDQEEAGDHAKRFALYSVLIAKKLGLDSKKVQEIEKFSPLHDIGKVVIPNEVLNKPGKLTSEEFEQVKKHSIIGYQLIQNIGLGKTAENIAKYHHEKWNGTGYPLGLKGEEIPIEARIASIVDTYDNLRQDKAYREGMTHEKAIEIIKNESGISFDPKLVEIFIAENDSFKKIYLENSVEIYLADEILTALKK